MNQQYTKNLPPVSWSITMDTPRFEAATGTVKTIFRVKTKRGRNVWSGGQIKEIFIDQENYRDLANVVGAMETQGESGEYSFSCKLDPSFASVDIAVITEEGKEIRKSFPIPEIKPLQMPKPPTPNWLNVVIDSQANKDNKAACTMTVITAKDGEPIDGKVEISCVRPIAIDGGTKSNKTTVDVTKVKSCIVELFPEEGEEQQELTFHLVGTGIVIAKLVKVMKPEPVKPTPKAGWFNATCGNPCTDKKVKGRIVVKTTKDGDLVRGNVRVSSSRPFVIEKDNITGTVAEQREWPLTVDGEILFEIQMSSDANHKQQQIFFVLQETGQEVKILLAIM